MKIEYKESQTPGRGQLLFSEALIPEGPWGVAIQRASDKKYLTGRKQNPWIGEAFFMPLNGAAQPDGGLALEAGPEIVDQLDQQEGYRASLKGASGEPERGRLLIPAITYSRSGSLDNTASAAPGPEAKPEAPIQLEQPKPEPEAAPEPALEAGPSHLEMEKPAAPASRLGKKWLWLVLLILLCAAWYAFDPRSKDQAPQPAPQEAQEARIEEPAKAPRQTAEQRVRDFFRSGSPSPGQALDLAAELNKATPQDQDAVYRLYYFAAENGDPSALMLYGACFDPSLPQWGTIDKDALQAWNAYKKAPNQAEAAKAMTNLRAWLEDKSQMGDKQATQWLREIEE